MFEIEKDNFLFGTIFLSLGVLLIFHGRDLELQCTWTAESFNQCKLVSYSLIGVQTIKKISNVEGAILEQQVYEPLPGKKSIVDSRVIIRTHNEKVPLGDDYVSKLDKGVVEGVNFFVKDKNNQLIRLSVSKNLHLAYIGVALILGSLVLIKKSVQYHA
jgi:hypothetical protein